MRQKNLIPDAEFSLVSARYKLILANMDAENPEVARIIEDIWSLEDRLSKVIVTGESA